MILRKQRMGKQKPWTLEELKAGLEAFYKEHQHYPTATEVDKYPYLPSARSIERQFGGLVKLRQELRLGENFDFRTGEHSTHRAQTINKRAHITEAKVYEFLIGRFGKEFVHREYFFTDDHRTRADFFVYDAGKGFCVDVFYPDSPKNLTGCLNVKLIKYARMRPFADYPVVFLQMNETISQERLDGLVKTKKKPLGADRHLMTWGTFEAFCNTRDPLGVLRGSMVREKLGIKD